MRDSNPAMQSGKRNHILALLSVEDYERLLGDAVLVSLPIYKELYRDGAPIDAVYFPLDSVVSITIGDGENESNVEVATIGNEGVAGAYSMLDGHRSIGTNIVQLAGDALRVEMSPFQKRLNESAPLEKLIHRYIYALTRQVVQAAACHRLHTMEERCARWLLMVHDRSGKDTFALTQEFLSEMLGVRRATVNLAVGILKAAGLIDYVRGQITVIDRPGLESVSCPCYELIRKEFERLGAA